jgi:serine/threonine protein phosphatase 1
MARHRDSLIERRLQDVLDDGNSVWVVGDVHGYLKTFQLLIESLELQEGDMVVCLGDLIDRGPSSRQVLEFVSSRDDIVTLRGNHEEMLRLSLTPKYNGRMMKSWLKYGGLETLASFDPVHEVALSKATKWVNYIANLPTEIVLGKYRLFHAGYDPNKSDDEQTDQDRMWSRALFGDEGIIDLNRQIIVGHTPVQKLGIIAANSIWSSKHFLEDGRVAVLGIDTAVYASDEHNARLTAVLLHGNELRYMRRVESSSHDL